MDQTELTRLHHLLQKLLRDHEIVNSLSLLEQSEIAGTANIIRSLNHEPPQTTTA